MKAQMKITLIINPKSGRGKALEGARSLDNELCRRGHAVSSYEMMTRSEVLERAIAGSDRVVVLGGDGTVHHLLPILAQTKTPMYHFGTGTANLISKEFGMSRSADRVSDHLEAEFVPILADLPTCNGRPFLIMVSVGIDASVIHRFEESRTKKGGYRAYVQPVLREILSPRPARYILEHSTEPPYRGTGVLVVANIKSYGGGFNPCPSAKPDDGQLHTVSIPCKTSLGAGLSYGFLKYGLTRIAMKRGRSDSLCITSEHPGINVQVDGEKASYIPGLIDGKLSQGGSLLLAMSEHKIFIHAPE